MTSRFPVLVPLVMMCHMEGGGHAVRHVPGVIHSDLVFCLLVLVLSVSNGYIGNTCMIFSPQMVKLPAEREAVSIFMNSMNVIGIATGSTVSYFLTKLV